MSRFADWASNATFRLRLLRMTFLPLDRIPAAVIIALDEPAYDFAPYAAAQLTDGSWPAV